MWKARHITIASETWLFLCESTPEVKCLRYESKQDGQSLHSGMFLYCLGHVRDIWKAIQSRLWVRSESVLSPSPNELFSWSGVYALESQLPHLSSKSSIRECMEIPKTWEHIKMPAMTNVLSVYWALLWPSTLNTHTYQFYVWRSVCRPARWETGVKLFIQAGTILSAGERSLFPEGKFITVLWNWLYSYPIKKFT